MIDLLNDTLVFDFPVVHSEARLRISFPRTLRIPDDGRKYPLPPGLGEFPVRRVDEYVGSLPPQWAAKGGVLIPMFQSEAMWILFRPCHPPCRASAYPFAIRIEAGGVDAITGATSRRGLSPGPQNYIVAPRQPWLDGFCVEKGVVRQFVAMPLGKGYTAEEQITGAAAEGGMVITVYPMKGDVYDRRLPKLPPRPPASPHEEQILFSTRRHDGGMGLAPGGKIKQEIYKDLFGIDDWDLDHAARCQVRIVNSTMWKQITGEPMPQVPVTASDYADAGLPWFDYYTDSPAVAGSAALSELKSVFTLGKDKPDDLFASDESVIHGPVVTLGEGTRVRECDR